MKLLPTIKVSLSLQKLCLDKGDTIGSHLKGDFKVYIKAKAKELLINELQLESSTTSSFSFSNFLLEINNGIPSSIPRKEIYTMFKNNKNVWLGRKIIDDEDKTVLIGTTRLTVGTPQDKTLRKLFFYVDANPNDLDKFIDYLKKANMTLAWTTEDNRYRTADINTLINTL